jgi:hypothetical protein
MGTDPGVAKQEERIASREASLKGEEDKAPWMALMQAGLATMAGTSPNAFANIGEGASKGLTSYGESKKAISARADKLDDLRSKIEESQRAEALAAVKYGLESAERRRLSDHTDKLKGAEAQLKYNEDVAKHGIEKEKLGIERQKADDDVNYHKGYLEYLKSKGDAANSGDGLTAAQARLLKSNDTNIKTVKELIENASKPGEAEFYTEKLKGLLVRRQEIEGGGEPIKLYTPPAQPVKGPDFMDRVLHPIDAWNGNLPGQNTETPSAIKLPSGATVKRVG